MIVVKCAQFHPKSPLTDPTNISLGSYDALKRNCDVFLYFLIGSNVAGNFDVHSHNIYFV